jgi:transcriptional regulator with PAS, ATPase and Fis domain
MESLNVSIADGVFTVSPEWRITSWNRAAEQITGFSREEAVGSFCHDVFRASVCQSGCVLRQTMETGENLINRPINILTPSALAALMAHPFPGNVRELENAIEHAFVMCRGAWIDIQHLPQEIVAGRDPGHTGPVRRSPGKDRPGPRDPQDHPPAQDEEAGRYLEEKR